MPELRNDNGEQLFHLRRIGPQATTEDAVDKMDFYNVTSIIGRNVERVDFVIDSSNHVQSKCLSRSHARIVRQPINQHRLFDDSLNGVFVNNIKIAGSCVLREGDRVTFGHPHGRNLPAGKRERQPESEHQFLFEKCNCENANQTKTPEVEGTKGKQEGDSEFKVPVVRTSASQCCHEKRGRKQTQSFTQEDILQLKQAWNEQSASSSKEIRSESCEMTAASYACEDTISKLSVAGDDTKASSDVDCGDNSAEIENKNASASGESNMSDIDTVDTNSSSTKHDMKTDSNEPNSTKQDSNCSTRPLEEAVESIMQDLATIRNIVESPTRKSNETDSVVTRPIITVSGVSELRSPTKDACIQTCDAERCSTPPITTVVPTHGQLQLSSGCVVDESLERKHSDHVKVRFSTDNTTGNTDVASENEDENPCKVTSSLSGLSEPIRERITTASSEVDKDDTSAIDDFECEILPKENKVENDTESHGSGEENQNNNKADYMLSDSIDYGYIEDSSSDVSDNEKTDNDRDITDDCETNFDLETVDGNEISSDQEIFESESDKESIDDNETEPDREKEIIDEKKSELAKESMDGHEPEPDEESETESGKENIYGNETDKESIDETEFDKESIEETEQGKENIYGNETDKESMDETEFDKESIEETEQGKENIYGNETDKESMDETEFDKESIEETEPGKKIYMGMRLTKKIYMEMRLTKKIYMGMRLTKKVWMVIRLSLTKKI